MRKLLFLSLILLNTYGMEAFQEQTPLPMSTPNIAKETQVKWIPLESSTKSTISPTKNIDESIKNQIQKKMQSLLKPLKDDENEQ